jgi:hypothetical protein
VGIRSQENFSELEWRQSNRQAMTVLWRCVKIESWPEIQEQTGLTCENCTVRWFLKLLRFQSEQRSSTSIVTEIPHTRSHEVLWPEDLQVSWHPPITIFLIPHMYFCIIYSNIYETLLSRKNEELKSIWSIGGSWDKICPETTRKWERGISHLPYFWLVEWLMQHAYLASVRSSADFYQTCLQCKLMWS